MKERPILFNGEMVRAILDGRKTQTRRVVKRNNMFDLQKRSELPDRSLVHLEDYCPNGRRGNRLWVRETWRTDPLNGDTHYRADHNPKYGPDHDKWIPSIHMPRWASRINLEITDVRVERVQDISEGDAKAEGVEVLPEDDVFYMNYQNKDKMTIDPCESFQTLWDSINEKWGRGWQSTPWVWVIDFKLSSANRT